VKSSRFVVMAGRLGVPRAAAERMQRQIRSRALAVISGKTTGRRARALSRALAREAVAQ
jgi:hypothetical protein